MKKFYLYIIVVLLFVGANGCKKEAINQQTVNEDEMMMRSKKVIALIQNFEQKMNDALKSGETITLDSAIWNMEASLNYNYADPGEAVGEYTFSKSNYILEVDANGEVSMGDVQQLYADMEQDLGNNYKSGDDTVVIFSDVALDSIAGGTAYLSGTNGYSSGIARNYTPIDDDWIWGTLTDSLAGNCDQDDMTSDGSNELEWRLNNPLPTSPVPIYGYTDIVKIEIDGTQGAYSDRLYIDFTGDDDACLSISDLTYYLGESDEIIYTYQGQNDGIRPIGKDLINVVITDDVSPGLSTYLHRYAVRYGIPLLVPPPN